MRIKIMVPLDGSAFSEQPLTEAVELARRSNAQLHLVRVHSPVGPGIGPGAATFLPGDREDGRAAEQAYLERIAADRRCHGLSITTTLLTGAIADSLAAHAESNGINLIVLSTHGRGGISRAWMGSVADELIRTTRIPVLLFRSGPVRGNAWELLPHILITLDGSAVSESIIEPATALGSLLNARYTLLQVVNPPIDASTEVYEQTRIVSEADGAGAKAYLETWAARLRAEGLDVRTRVAVRSQSAAGIVEEARDNDCDMIAMATHGRSGWQRLILGSVTDKVLRTTAASVLTVSAGV